MLKPFLLAAALLVTAPCFSAHAAEPVPDFKIGERLAAKPQTPKEISWDDLLPPGWNPAKELEGLDLDKLDDADPRAMDALAKLRAMWNAAPPNRAMAGRAIRIPGFVVPLEYGKKALTEFLLVPYFGACIHVPPPPANQVIHVVTDTPYKTKTYMDAVWIEGVVEVAAKKTDLGDAGYRVRASKVEVYVEKPAKKKK